MNAGLISGGVAVSEVSIVSYEIDALSQAKIRWKWRLDRQSQKVSCPAPRDGIVKKGFRLNNWGRFREEREPRKESGEE